MVTVAQYIADFLVEKGVRHVFGFQGGAVIKLIDSMIATGKIDYVQNYQEQASAFCADSYSRINGRLGVAIATSGPGATNLVTGIANAYLDSVPTFFITGQDYTANVLGKGAARQNGFQDLDIVSIVKPITKYAVLLTDPKRVRYEVEKAFYMATSPRQGAVLLDIPIDIQFKEIDPATLEGFTPEPTPTYDLHKVADVVSLLKTAKRPVILAGGGIRSANALSEFSDLLNITNIPVVATLNGLDATEKAYSFAGLYGNTFSNLAVLHADVLLVLGARLGQRQVGKVYKNYTNAKIIHVDIDAVELGRSIPEELSVFADLKPFIARLNAALGQEKLASFVSWHKKIQTWKKLYQSNTELNKDALDPVRAVRKIATFLKDDAIVTADVGQNQMWVAQGTDIKATQRILNSCGLGSMGYSLPAAIGARIANPTAQIVAYMGDGGFHMNMQELLLVGHKQLNIKCVVMNNNTLGMMREVQKRYYNEHYYGANTADFVCADLKKLAVAFDLGYVLVNDEASLSSLGNVMNDDEPYLIDMRLPFDSLLLNRYDELSIFEKEKAE